MLNSRKAEIDDWKQKEASKSLIKEPQQVPIKDIMGVRFASDEFGDSFENMIEGTKELNIASSTQNKNKKSFNDSSTQQIKSNKLKIRKPKVRNKTALPSDSESTEEEKEDLDGRTNSQHSRQASYYDEIPPQGPIGYECGNESQIRNTMFEYSPNMSQPYNHPYGQYSQQYMPQYEPGQNMNLGFQGPPYIQRPTTLLEAQEINKQNQKNLLQQMRFAPSSLGGPQSGLVGAISALQAQKSQAKQAKFNNNGVPQNQVYNHFQDQAGLMEREKERLLYEQRMMANGRASPLNQSRVYPNMGEGYNDFYNQSVYFPQNESQFYAQDMGMSYGQFQTGYPEDDDDDVALGALANANNKKNIIKPTRINRSKIKDAKKQTKNNESEEEELSEPDIPEDIIDAFEEFIDKKLQMKPYSYVLPSKAFEAFVDWCQDEDIEEYLWPDEKSFDYMMENNGFVKKKKPKNAEKDDSDHNIKWWHNISLVD